MSATRGGSKRGGGSKAGPLLLAALLATLAAHAGVLAAKLANAPRLPWGPLLPLGLYAALLAAVWVWLRVTRFAGDPVPLAAALTLTGLGVAVQFRVGTFAETGLGSSVVLAYPLGVAAMLAMLLFFGGGRARLLAAAEWPAYAAALAVLVGMLALGRSYRGGTFLAGNLNPSEIVKPLLVVFLAAFLSGRRAEFSSTQAGIPMPARGALLELAVFWAIPMGLVLLLKDIGLFVLLNAVLVLMLYAVARKPGYLVTGAAAVVLLALAAGLVSAHARARFGAWHAPFEDPTGRSWQVLQALAALHSGGLWGAGIGAGAPQTVPIVSSDFIYAALGEELGFAGCVLLLTVYGVLFARGWRIAAGAAGPFGQLLGVGLTSALAVQALLNVAGVTKALPLTGITLPFVSQGGSSLATSLAMVGLLAALSSRGGGRTRS
jgi:cell division protein FtsW (lipid II flippase)